MERVSKSELKAAIFKVLEPSLKEKYGRLGTSEHNGSSSESADKVTFCYQPSQPENDLGKGEQL